MPDKPGSEGLSQDDLDALKAAEEAPPTFSPTPSQAELDRLAADSKGGMRIEDVANFETFPPVPEQQFISQLEGTPKRPGFLDGVDTSKPWTTFDEEAAKARLEALGPQPMTAETVADFQTFPPIDAPPPPNPMDRVANFETFPPLPPDAPSSGGPLGGLPGGIPKAVIGAGAGVLLLGLALVAMLGRGSDAQPTTAAGAPSSTAMVASAAAKGGAGAPWPGCSAAPVPASAAEAIPQDKRWMVAAYCFGAHYYPTEQFQWSSAPGCTEPGVIGNTSHLVTKHGGPAQAIDDPNASLADPRPGGCGFLAMHEAKKQEQAIRGKFPDASNNMYPAHTDIYRAFQARVGGGR